MCLPPPSACRRTEVTNVRTDRGVHRAAAHPRATVVPVVLAQAASAATARRACCVRLRYMYIAYSCCVSRADVSLEGRQTANLSHRCMRRRPRGLYRCSNQAEWSMVGWSRTDWGQAELWIPFRNLMTRSWLYHGSGAEALRHHRWPLDEFPPLSCHRYSVVTTVFSPSQQDATKRWLSSSSSTPRAKGQHRIPDTVTRRQQ